MDLRAIIPGYEDALQKESIVREAPLLGLNDRIGPFHVRYMTLRDYIALKRHPLLNSQAPSVGEIVVFIRFLWIGNRKDKSISNALAKWLFGRRCFKYVMLNFQEIEEACIQYLTDSLMDSVSSISYGWNPPFYSEAIEFIDLFSRIHGWSPAYTLDLPIALALQYRRRIEHSTGIQPPNRSDKMIADYTLNLRRN